MMPVVSVGLVLMLSLALPFLLRPLLERLGVVDVPNARSSHQIPTLRGVGLAPLIATALGFIATIFWMIPEGAGRTTLLIVLSATVAAGVLGLVEDIWGVRVGLRATIQLLIGLGSSVGIVLLVSAPGWLIPVFAICIAAYTNIANFMDGVNAMSGLHGVVVGACFAVIGVLVGLPWLVVSGSILAAALAGFLPWNVFGRRVFLGDVGSYFLGGFIAVVASAAIAQGVSIVAVLSPLSIYIADTGVTLARRVLRGERWYTAHRSHVYQRLTEKGISHLTVSLIVFGASLISSALGLLTLGSSPAIALAISGVVVAIAGAYIALPWIIAGGTKATVVASDPLILPESDLPARSQDFSARTWAVVGASGFIGSALVDGLRARQLDVIEVNAPRVEFQPSANSDVSSESVAERHSEVESLAKAIAGADVVVNAAGQAAPDARDSPSLYGANSLLPVLVATAAGRARASRFVHLSSAAVQGRRPVLDESRSTSPFSPYSTSKALGEAGLLSWAAQQNVEKPELVIIRATSVQGRGRATTKQLRRLAGSWMSSVAGPGDRPTVVSSLRGLVDFIIEVGGRHESIPTIVLQPWEGLTTGAVLEAAGRKPPRKIPAALCRFMVVSAFTIGAVAPPIKGIARRVELMWFGQRQDATWAQSVGIEGYSHVAEVFDMDTEPQ